MAQNKSLNVAERIEAAIAQWEHSSDRPKITVAAICKSARANRGNVYASHPELVNKILQLKPSKSDRLRAPDIQKVDDSAGTIAALEARNRALLLQCLELKVALNIERERRKPRSK